MGWTFGPLVAQHPALICLLQMEDKVISSAVNFIFICCRHVSRANIKISNAEKGCANRQITIIGTPDVVDNALYLINAIQAKYSKN